MLNIALFEPKIPQNTGNIIRLVANNGFLLHLIGPLAFSLDDKNLQRAGLDYHDIATVALHESYDDFLSSVSGKRIFAITTKGAKYYQEVLYKDGDVLLFGSETAGLPDKVRQSLPSDCLIRIPMKPNNRSLNLSNSVAIVSYEAWRQLGFDGSI